MDVGVLGLEMKKMFGTKKHTYNIVVFDDFRRGFVQGIICCICHVCMNFINLELLFILGSKPLISNN